ncbi:MAG: NHL repeat-containing protein [Phycisphaerales bacterium]|nr:NHL repeat-containing protein [Phycisphaerales bacterium]
MKQLYYSLIIIAVLCCSFSCSKSPSNRTNIGPVIIAGGNGAGSALNQLNLPGGIYIDGKNNLYIADSGNNRVVYWAAGATSGTVIYGGNGTGSELNKTNGPYALRPSDKSDSFFIAGFAYNRVVKFPPPVIVNNQTSAPDIYGVVVAGGNGQGSGDNQLSGPDVMAVDQDTIYIADTYNNRIVKWAPDASTGTVYAGTGTAGSGLNELNSPASIYLTKNKYLYVSDQLNNRVIAFPPNCNGNCSGTVVAGGNGAGSALNQFNVPTAIILNSAGDLYVTDSKNDRALKFPAGSTSATMGILVAGGNGRGSAINQLANPYDIYLDPQQNIVILDYLNNRVVRWPAK